MERVMGIEPTCAAWKAAVLPLNYTRKVLHSLAAEHPLSIVLKTASGTFKMVHG